MAARHQRKHEPAAAVHVIRPLGIAAIVATLLLFPADTRGEVRPFDVRGFALVGAGCFSVLYGMDIVGQPGAQWPLAAGLIEEGVSRIGGLK